MKTTDKIMLFGILTGLSITLYSIWLASQINRSCENIEEQVIKYERMQQINLL